MKKHKGSKACLLCLGVKTMGKGLNVLSLFDGMACGLQALKVSGVPVENYYASEIDKSAVIIAKKNHPEIQHIGDVENHRDWNLPKIDLILGGSPCQGFSFAGKQLAFDDPRSRLFFTFNEIVAIETLKNPNLKFLLENVKMHKDHLKIISLCMGVQPIFINSQLVSAQCRQRYYWTNIEGVVEPVDRNINLCDILEDNLLSCNIGGRIVGRRINELGKRDDYNKDIPIIQYLELRTDNKSNCLTTVYKDSVVPYFKTDKRLKIKFNQKKASCLTGGANSGGNHSDMDMLIIHPDVCRRYSVTECERLQTLPDNYTEGVSNTQRYKMLGNGWTVEVIAHILSQLEVMHQKTL